MSAYSSAKSRAATKPAASRRGLRVNTTIDFSPPCPALPCSAQPNFSPRYPLQGVAESFQCRAFLLISTPSLLPLPLSPFVLSFFFLSFSSLEFVREKISWERITRTWSNFNYTQRWRTRDIIVSLRNVGWVVGARWDDVWGRYCGMSLKRIF